MGVSAMRYFESPALVLGCCLLWVACFVFAHYVVIVGEFLTQGLVR